MIDGILDRLSDKPLGALSRYGLDTNTYVLWESNFGGAHFIDEEIDNFLGFITVRLVLNTRVNVLRVLTEDHHIGVAGAFQW